VMLQAYVIPWTVPTLPGMWSPRFRVKGRA